MIPFYQLPNYLEFLSKYRFPDDRSKHTAELAWAYYKFSYYQMLTLSKTCNNFFKIENPDHDTVMENLNKCWSYAYGMYALLRTTLDAIRIFRKMVNDKSSHARYYDDVKRIVDIANDVIKHPTFKPNQLSTGTLPISIMIGAEIDVVINSDDGTVKRMQIDPMKDFKIVRDYLNYIADKQINP